jgi:hypothetical protein
MKTTMKYVFILLAIVLLIVVCSVIYQSATPATPAIHVTLVVTSEPVLGDSAASQKATADYAMQQAQLLEANAQDAAVNETAQTDATNFPATQSAMFAQQTLQALAVKSTDNAQAMILAQQQAQATATAQAMSAQQTEQAIEVKVTGDARALLLAQQQAQATATALSMLAQQTAQEMEEKATTDARAMLLAQQQAQATATAQAMQREGVTAEQVARTLARQRELMSWLIPIVTALAFGLVLLLGAKYIAGMIDTANERRSLENQRLALLATLFEAPTETILFVDDPQTGFAMPKRLKPDNSKGDDESNPVVSHTPMIDTEAPQAVVLLSYGDKMLADHAELREEQARCKLAMKLLRDAIKHVGAQSNHIPPAAQLGWPAEAWSIAVDILKMFDVEILQGIDGGTYFVGQYPTLQAFYIAIGERRLTLNPPSAKSGIDG